MATTNMADQAMLRHVAYQFARPALGAQLGVLALSGPASSRCLSTTAQWMGCGQVANSP